MPAHYYIEKITDPLVQLAAKKRLLDGPCFVGQGCTQQVGSDSYGYYVTDMKKAVVRGKERRIYGLVDADAKFETSWTDGSQICTMPEDRGPSFWIVSLRRHKNGIKKWQKCFRDGTICSKDAFAASWNGAFGYQDPSF